MQIENHCCAIFSRDPPTRHLQKAQDVFPFDLLQGAAIEAERARDETKLPEDLKGLPG